MDNRAVFLLGAKQERREIIQFAGSASQSGRKPGPSQSFTAE
jgi:hypothetical protein